MAARQPARRNTRTSTKGTNSKSRPGKSGGGKRTAATGKAAEKPSNRTLPIAAAAGLVGAALAGLGLLLRRRKPASKDGSFGTGEHLAADLKPASTTTGTSSAQTERAPEAFRPDPTAPVPPEERDALRPALAKPTMVDPDREAEARADTAGGSTLSPQGGRVTSADQPAGDNIVSGAASGATSPEPDRVATPPAPGVGNL